MNAFNTGSQWAFQTQEVIAVLIKENFVSDKLKESCANEYKKVNDITTPIPTCGCCGEKAINLNCTNMNLNDLDICQLSTDKKQAWLSNKNMEQESWNVYIDSRDPNVANHKYYRIKARYVVEVKHENDESIIELIIPVCGYCKSYIDKAKIPKYGIVNGHDYGLTSLYQKFRESLSYSEIEVLSQVRLFHDIFKISSTKASSSKMSGHMISFKQEMTKILTEFPSLDGMNEAFRIIFMDDKHRIDQIFKNKAGNFSKTVSIRPALIIQFAEM